MTWAGAAGETRAEMAETLGFTFEEATVHRAFAELWHELDSRSDVDRDERGTEATAATGVPLAVDGPENPFELAIDRPFLFAIRDRPTGTILFFGRIVDVAGFA